jgi:hypothetical protein
MLEAGTVQAVLAGLPLQLHVIAKDAADAGGGKAVGQDELKLRLIKTVRYAAWLLLLLLLICIRLALRTL